MNRLYLYLYCLLRAVALYRSQLQLICKVRPPVNGDYVLTLFGSLVHKDQPVLWLPVARFTLQVSGVAKCPAPFPCGSGLEYGPQKLATQEALWTSSKCESYLETATGTCAHSFGVRVLAPTCSSELN